MEKGLKLDPNKALEFAKKAHAGQMRKFSDIPYWTHPKAVGDMLAAAGLPPEAVAAGYLHDVIEDTEVGENAIRAAFGQRVLDLVLEVSHPPGTAGLPWERRKELHHAHYAKASYLGKSIKLADLLHNLSGSKGAPDEFRVKYVAKLKQRLPLLKGGHFGLWMIAKKELDAHP